MDRLAEPLPPPSEHKVDAGGDLDTGNDAVIATFLNQCADDRLEVKIARITAAFTDKSFSPFELKSAWPDKDPPTKKQLHEFLNSFSWERFTLMTPRTRRALWTGARLYYDLTPEQFPYPRKLAELDEQPATSAGAAAESQDTHRSRPKACSPVRPAAMAAVVGLVAAVIAYPLGYVSGAEHIHGLSPAAQGLPPTPEAFQQMPQLQVQQREEQVLRDIPPPPPSGQSVQPASQGLPPLPEVLQPKPLLPLQEEIPSRQPEGQSAQHEIEP